MSELNEIRTLVEGIVKAQAAFIEAHEKSQKDSDVLLKEAMKKAADEVAEKYEQAQKRYEALEGRLNGIAKSSDENKLVQKQAEEFYDQAKSAIEPQSFVTRGLVRGDVAQYEAYTKAFRRYLKTDRELLSSEVLKDLSLGNDPDGGYFMAPPTMHGSIVKRLYESTPMRQIATVQPISTHEYKVPMDPNELDAGWVAERQVRPPTGTPTIAVKTITAHEIYAQPAATQIILEDSAIDSEQWLSDKIADKFSRVENAAFVSGDGVGKPQGFLTYTAGVTPDKYGTNVWGKIGMVPSGTAGGFTYDTFIQLLTSLKEQYLQNASFLVRRGSIAPLMTLKDGNGRYIFQPIASGEFNNLPLFGYPLHYAADMPLADGVTSGVKAVAFGDFKRGYIIVDRVGISTLRDPYTQKGFILFYTRKRVGGDVVDFDAIKVMILQ